jgi:hypothetical protein
LAGGKGGLSFSSKLRVKAARTAGREAATSVAMQTWMGLDIRLKPMLAENV